MNLDDKLVSELKENEQILHGTEALTVPRI